MLTVRLLTSNLEFVADVELPPFIDRGMPEVVMWMERCFLRHGRYTEGPWFYIEAFWMVSPTSPPGLPRGEPLDTRPDLPRTMRKTGGH